MKKCPVCKTKLYDGDKQCCTCNYVFPPERPTSKLCLAGFICAFVPSVVYIFHISSSMTINPVTLTLGWIGLALAFILSIIGMIRGKKKKIAYGIAGVTIALVELIPWFLISCLAWSFSSSKVYDYSQERDPYMTTTGMTSVVQEYIEEENASESETMSDDM